MLISFLYLSLYAVLNCLNDYQSTNARFYGTVVFPKGFAFWIFFFVVVYKTLINTSQYNMEYIYYTAAKNKMTFHIYEGNWHSEHLPKFL